MLPLLPPWALLLFVFLSLSSLLSLPSLSSAFVSCLSPPLRFSCLPSFFLPPLPFGSASVRLPFPFLPSLPLPSWLCFCLSPFPFLFPPFSPLPPLLIPLSPLLSISRFPFPFPFPFQPMIGHRIYFRSLFHQLNSLQQCALPSHTFVTCSGKTL